MLSTVKIDSSIIDTLRRRVAKFLRFGKGDVQTSLEVSPYGVDANPIKDMIAIYAKTQGKGDTFIIGYVNKNQMANVGELRTYSTDASGQQKFYTWLKNNGTYEIGGNTKHMTRFEELKTGFDQLKADHNALAQKWDAFTSTYVPGSPSALGLPATLAGQNVGASSASIDSAKINEIKTL